MLGGWHAARVGAKCGWNGRPVATQRETWQIGNINTYWIVRPSKDLPRSCDYFLW